MPNYHIPQDYFIKVYNESDTLKEVSMKTGLKESGITAKANRLRKSGIQLKRYVGGIKARVSDSEFIKIWNNATSLDEVIKLTKINDITGIHNRRRKLIKMGIQLKPIRKERNQYTLTNEELINSGFGYWLAGFIDGEGCLNIGLRSYKRIINEIVYNTNELEISLTVSLRADDKSTLEYIRDTLECGYISSKKHYLRDNPQYSWRVTKIDDLLNRIIPILSQCPLHTKKKNELPLVIRASKIKYQSILLKYSGAHTRSGKRLTDEQLSELNEIITQLRENRRYK